MASLPTAADVDRYMTLTHRPTDASSVRKDKELAPYLIAKFKIPKKNFRHLYGELNLNEIKNALHNLPVNRETNLINLIRP